MLFNNHLKGANLPASLSSSQTPSIVDVVVVDDRQSIKRSFRVFAVIGRREVYEFITCPIKGYYFSHTKSSTEREKER